MLRGEEMPLTSNFPGWEKQIAGTKKPALGGLGSYERNGSGGSNFKARQSVRRVSNHLSIDVSAGTPAQQEQHR